MKHELSAVDKGLLKFRLPFLVECITLVPFILSPIYLLFVGILNTQEFMTAATDPLVIISHVVLVIVPIIYSKYSQKRISSYDGTENSAKSLNKMLQWTRFIIIGYNVVISFFTAISITHAIRISGAELQAFGNANPHVIIFFIYLGWVWIAQTALMELFISRVEHFASWLPFDRCGVTASNRERIIVFSLLILIGYFFVMGATISIEKIVNNEIPYALYKAFGMSTGVGVVFLLTAMITVALDVAHNLREEKAVIFALANKDFTAAKAKVLSRNDFGILTNDINAVYDFLKDIFQTISGSVQGTIEVSSEVSGALRRLQRL